MDELNDFFGGGRAQGSYELHGSASRQAQKRDAERNRSVAPSGRSGPRSMGTEYADEVLAQEALMQCEPDDYPMEDQDDQDDEESDRAKQRVISDLIYQKYRFDKPPSDKLPIDTMKDEILNGINMRQVSIIEGPTGCGKTTRIPQWILHDCVTKRRHCNIVVTQPRRIATIGVANRVAAQHNCNVGDLIGYQIGLEKKISSDTHLLYVTTGVLLQQIIKNKSLRQYTHIVLDEVHERDKEMDFLLIIIKKLLRTNSRSVKVILMSATIQTKRFANYFATQMFSHIQDNPVIKIKEEGRFEVHTYYLENIAPKLGQMPDIDFDKPKISHDLCKYTVKLLNALEKIDMYEEKFQSEEDRRPCILIFLPGLGEIEDLFTILNNDSLRQEIDPRSPLNKWYLVPLHSSINLEEQLKAFGKVPFGHRKILLSTNIAESSITVTDVKYVIDFCLTKTSVCNAQTNYSSLQLSWASRANLTQRAGRVGRVRNGKVYRMIPHFFFDKLQEEITPEMKRTNLENLILHSKMIDMGPPKYLLGLAIDPPNLTNIHQTILVLKEIGALLKEADGKYSNEDGDLTYLGYIMANLPLDVKVTKLIMLGYIFGCLEECIIIGAAISIRNLFSNPFMLKMRAFTSKLMWAHGSASDCIALLNAYKVYKTQKEQNNFMGGEHAWARSMFVQIKALRELDKLVTEIKMRLKSEDIYENIEFWTPIQYTSILKVIIAGAFYPNYFTYSNSVENDGKDAVKTLNGMDPYNTVYLSGMDNKQPGDLYSSQLKKRFECCTKRNINVEFDKNSSKIFITFPSSIDDVNDKIPGKVSMAVYKAIKMRQLKESIQLRVMPLRKSLERAAEIGLHSFEHARSSSYTSENEIPKYLSLQLPAIEETHINLLITKYINCGHFWARYADDYTRHLLDQLSKFLNMPDSLVPLRGMPVVGELVAVPQGRLYYRAVVESFNSNEAIVLLIDYGGQLSISISEIKWIKPNACNILKVHPFAFECVLAEISPSLAHNGEWTDEANNRFHQLTRAKDLVGKIFSVAFSVISLELLVKTDTELLNVNNILLKEGYAQISEEGYVSKLNKDLRNRADRMHPSELKMHNQQQYIQNMPIISDIVAPNPSECSEVINLKGPSSPLETHLNNLFHVSSLRNVQVEQDSVNSVVLNTDFHCQTEQLLVAANISESPNGLSHIARNTTLMPNIPGLPALISLMFCPTTELHCDSSSCYYVSALCGLGHIDGKPIFPDHDMVVNINIEMNVDDVKNINHLRHIMNDYLMLDLRKQPNKINREQRNNNLLKIKNIIHNLLSHTHKRHNFSSNIDNWKWNGVAADNKLGFTLTGREIFTPIQPLNLEVQNEELLYQLAIENAQIRDIVFRSTNMNDAPMLGCSLCGIGQMSLESLRLHMLSRMHRDRESDLPKLKRCE